MLNYSEPPRQEGAAPAPPPTAPAPAPRLTAKPELLALSGEEILALLASYGEPRYRAEQLRVWISSGTSLQEMSNLPRALRERLREDCVYELPQVREKQVSRDGTVKYLFALADGECVESVVLRYEYGLSACLSTEAGCAMGCAFCASTLRGKRRALTPGEILGQLLAASRDLGERIAHVVLMGIGEPLDNYDSVLCFLRRVTDPGGVALGARAISLSTCGIVPRIRDLSREGIPLTLSVSLHAPRDDLRSRLMPINRRYPLRQLLPALAGYYRATGRRISFEYTLLRGVNDSPREARELALLLKENLPGMPHHVNLIPYSAVKERPFRSSPRAAVSRFRDILAASGVTATVRRRLGGDITASCGQLRNRARAPSEEE